MSNHPAEPRKTGVTIVMNGQALFTNKPCDEDGKFFNHMGEAHQKWVREGRPQSGS